MPEFKFPTETVELPSKGFFYPAEHPLKEGKVEMKYMTAKEEDILANANYIQQGIVLDKLLESLIISPKFNLEDLLIGDKNALLVAARILGYGSNYTVSYGNKTQTIDLSKLENINNDFTGLTEGKNEFSYIMPATGTEITFKLLTGKDEKMIDKELEGLRKVNPNAGELTTRFRFIITSVGGNRDMSTIVNFVDNYLLASDSRALREHYKNTMPDVDMSYEGEDGRFRTIPIGLDFFWPDVAERF
jgi:hypothetical protein